MVQKKKSAVPQGRGTVPRGRPRAYEPDAALAQARDAFWKGGYVGTSLDDIKKATRMNRPSLYAAFGDKRELYLKVMDRYRAMGRNGLQEELNAGRPIAEDLRSVFARAISIYVSGGGRGCFLIGTATTDALGDASIRESLKDGLHELDHLFELRMKRAVEEGELRTEVDLPALARIACGIMNSLALRARAGESRESLEETADAAVLLICGRRGLLREGT